MKKRYILLLIVAAAIPVVAAVCIYYAKQTDSSDAVQTDSSRIIFDISADSVNSIEVWNGTTGEFVEILDEQQIQDIVKQLNTLEYTRLESDINKDVDGFSYSIQLYCGDDTLTYIFNDLYIEVDTTRYYVESDSYLGELIKVFDGDWPVAQA